MCNNNRNIEENDGCVGMGRDMDGGNRGMDGYEVVLIEEKDGGGDGCMDSKIEPCGGENFELSVYGVDKQNKKKTICFKCKDLIEGKLWDEANSMLSKIEKIKWKKI